MSLMITHMWGSWNDYISGCDVFYLVVVGSCLVTYRWQRLQLQGDALHWLHLCWREARRVSQRYHQYLQNVITKSEDELQIYIWILGEICAIQTTKKTCIKMIVLNQKWKVWGTPVSSSVVSNMKTQRETWRILSNPGNKKLWFLFTPRSDLIWVKSGFILEALKTSKQTEFISVTSSHHGCHWVEGKSPSDGPFQEPLSIQTEFEPIYIWLPYSMLNEYCCLSDDSDIPGCCLCHLM